MDETRQRSTRQVFEDHLRRRRKREVEEDISRNYAEEVVLLARSGVYLGHEGVRRSAHLLYAQLPCARYQYRTKLVEGETAFLEWAAHCPTAGVEAGADSFLIRNGRIVVQTIHYTVRRLQNPGKPKPRKHSSTRLQERNR